MLSISVAIKSAGSRVDLVQPSRLMIPTESIFFPWCLRKTVGSQHISDGDIAWPMVDYVVYRGKYLGPLLGYALEKIALRRKKLERCDV